MRNNRTKKLVFMALLSAVAVVLHSIETMLQLPLPLGMKLGLANIISLVVIQIYGVKEMFVVNLFRVIVSGLLTGMFGQMAFFISCGGVLLSSVALALVSKFCDLPIISTSIIAAVFHNIGQVSVVAFIYSQVAIMSYVFILLLSSIPTGILTGTCAMQIMKRIGKQFV